jgi:hypothetical protein
LISLSPHDGSWVFSTDGDAFSMKVHSISAELGSSGKIRDGKLLVHSTSRSRNTRCQRNEIFAPVDDGVENEVKDSDEDGDKVSGANAEELAPESI